MAGRLSTAGVLTSVALRNLWASRARTLIIGGIILFGTVLVVLGSSMLDSIDRGVRSSIQGSLAGHLQVFSATSKDDLALYGGMMGESDLDPIADFSKIKASLLKVPNVRAVVPMGIDQAMVTTGNLFDVALERLRADIRRRLAGQGDAQLEAAYRAHVAHLRRMIDLLQTELHGSREIADENGRDAAERAQSYADLARATSNEFWGAFDSSPLASLEFLENRIAPLSIEGGMSFVRYVGTDLDAYFGAFDRAYIVEGTPVPKGRRGILLGKLYAEDFLKLKTARRLDRIRDARDQMRRRIADDEELQRWVKDNMVQTRDILLQLDPVNAQLALERLQRALNSAETDLGKLVVELFRTTDADFDTKYEAFYSQMAPLLQLYQVRVGDVVTIKAPSKSGYLNAVNVKVYGFVQFKGLEKSAIAGLMSLMDIHTFRDLYGYLSADKLEEIRRLKVAAGARSVSRENAEAELFGTSVEVARSASAEAIDEATVFGSHTPSQQKRDLLERTYTQDEIDQGVAINAAVMLSDPGRASETQAAIEALSRREGLNLKVVDWQKASGLVGQFVTLARLVLYVAAFIIFAVALVIINNAMVMATLRRVKEIGTMRAIGAQPRFVLSMLLFEALTVGLTFGALGTAIGAGTVAAIRAAGGIPASNESLYLFFSGPALMPHLGTASLAVSIAIVLAVSVLSGLYPALLARKVAPVEAMQSED